MKNRAQVEEIARRYDETLGANDFSTGRLVIVRHSDGTEFFFRHAFLRTREDWVVVFTEHTSFHCFAIENLDEFAQFDESPEIGTL